MAVICNTPNGLNTLVTSIDNISQAWGLDISQEKTEIMSVDRNNTHPTPSITLRNQKLKQVNHFKYLGRTFSNTPTIETEISLRLQKANASFYRLAAPLYRRPEISTTTKIKIYKASVLPTLLYASSTWAPLLAQVKRLETFQIKCLRYILKIKFATHGNISHKTVRKRCNVRSISDTLRTNRLRLLGHISRMPNTRLPKKALFSFPSKKRPKATLRRNWRTQTSTDLKSIHQYHKHPTTTQNRQQWRKIIHMRPQQSRSDLSSRLRRSTKVQRSGFRDGLLD